MVGITKKAVTYRLDKDLLSLISKYGRDNKSAFVEKSIAFYIKNKSQPIKESNTIQQEQPNTYAINILQQQVLDLKQELKEEKIYYRDKLDNMELRYDKRIDEDIKLINDKFDKVMDSINDSRKYNYIPTHVRGLDINKPEYDTTMDKTIDEDKQEDLPERKGFWGRLFG